LRTKINHPFVGTDYEKALLYSQDYAIERGRRGLPVEAVSKVIYEALESRRPKSRYPVVRNRLYGWTLPQWLPDRLVDRIVNRMLKVND
jgi:hypothetical protein